MMKMILEGLSLVFQVVLDYEMPLKMMNLSRHLLKNEFESSSFRSPSAGGSNILGKDLIHSQLKESRMSELSLL